MRERFLIVDGNSLMHRAFHALPPLDADGISTNAVHGFLLMLLRALEEENPRYLAVAFDEHAPTFRHTVYAEYKAGRSPTPDELRTQFPLIREILSAMGAGVLSLAGYEADDILGTVAKMCGERGIEALLLTGDRDALQLVDDNTTLMLTRKGISEIDRCTPARVKELFGVTPGQVTDLKGLMGDSSDNIPGVPGVGEKTALKLLAEYGTLDETLKNAASVKGKLGERLLKYDQQARFSRELGTIRTDVPVVFRFSDCETTRLADGVPVLLRYKLNNLAQRLEKRAAPQKAQAEKTVSEAFPDWEMLTDADAAAAFLATLSGGPAAIYPGAEEISFVCGGHRARIPYLGQPDLLSKAVGLAPGDALRALSPLLSRPILAHDAKKLLHALSSLSLPMPRFSWDTLLAAYLIEPQRKSFALSGFGPDDACGVWELASAQQEKIKAAGMQPLYDDIELPLMYVLYDMERIGFCVDTGELRRIGDLLTARTEALREEIYTLSGTRGFNILSPQQLGKVLFETLGLPLGKKTRTGYATDADTLEALADLHPVIAPILEYRQATKLLSTYIDALIRKTGPDGRIHTSFDQTGTATGRISSAEPNLQNIPVRTPQGREIRRAFVAPEGWVLCDADYSQIELRILAHFSGDKAMQDAFLNGEDFHARTAAAVAGIPLEAVTPELRSRAKAVNFGIVYGISDFGLANNTGMSRKEASAFIAKYFETYPGVRRFMDGAVRSGYDTGRARTLFGRERPLPELASGNVNIRNFGERAAMNTPVQGTAADIIKLAMVRVHDSLQNGGYRARLILQVHDELIVESPAEEAEAVSALLRKCMESVAQLAVPLTAEVRTGKSWYDTK